MTEEAKKLVTDNHNLIYSFLNKYNLSIEDYYDAAALGLCKAAMAYEKGEKAAFSTYAYKGMYMNVMQQIRYSKCQKRMPKKMPIYYQKEMKDDDNKDLMLINIISSKENIEDIILSKIIIEEYISCLKERDRKVLMLLINGYKQQDIASIVGCKQSNISRIKRKFIKYLKNV